MSRWLSIPHRVAHGMCPVNGVRDLVQWRTGRDWANAFVHGLGQGGGFAYLRFNAATPPRQVYWGVAGPRQHEYLAQLLGASYAVVENRSFKLAWSRARQAVDGGLAPVLGPLDMFFLPYYPGLYRQRHIPIHYVLLVGYDDQRAYVHDTDLDPVQEIPLPELQAAWDVNVPGLGKRNRLVTFDIPASIPPTVALIRKAIADQCRGMLSPPVRLLGLPAMRKLAREITGWPEELGKEKAAASLRQVREYLNSPPDITGDHLTAGRNLYIAFLEEAGPLAGLDLSSAVAHLRASMGQVPALAAAIGEERLNESAALMEAIAAEETAAFEGLSRAVGSAP